MASGHSTPAEISGERFTYTFHYAPAERGLYFVGLHFLYSMTSGLVNGVGRDAERVVNAVAARVRSAPAPAEPAAVR